MLRGDVAHAGDAAAELARRVAAMAENECRHGGHGTERDQWTSALVARARDDLEAAQVELRVRARTQAQTLPP